MPCLAVLAAAACSSPPPPGGRVPYVAYELALEPPHGCAARGPRGGPFTIEGDAGAYAVHNDGSGCFLFTVEATAPWLLFDGPHQGMLRPLESLRLRLAVDAARVPADATATSAAILVRNAVTYVVEVRIPVRLEIAPAAPLHSTGDAGARDARGERGG